MFQSRKEAFAVVLGLSPTGLYAVRELGREGIAVFGVENSVQAGSFSRYLTGLLPEDERLLERLLELARQRGQCGVLIPTSDLYIEWVVQYRKELAEGFVFQGSYQQPVYQALVHKGGFSRLCKEHGLESPLQWECNTEEIERISSGVVYPCLIKPVLIHRVKPTFSGKKVLIARSQTELLSLAKALDSAGSWLIQEIIPGPESNITLFGAYVSKAGAIQQAFTGRKLRQFPPGFGSASLAISELLPESFRISERFLKDIAFEGIASLEFKKDARDGKIKVIELNPRPCFWYGLANKAGKRIVLAAFNELLGDGVLPGSAQKEGVVWRAFYKDLYSAAFYALKGKAFVLPPPELGQYQTSTGPVWDIEDPLPLWGELQNVAKKACTRLLKNKKPLLGNNRG
jgi:predicted ATP-grasp superfamily ATP-dependent carboligase